MNKKILGGIGAAAVAGIIAVIVLTGSLDFSPDVAAKNEPLGLVINTPRSSITPQDLDEIFETASTSGIGRSNVYMFWDRVEPEREKYDWREYDLIMGLNQKNDLKVTLYFSLINGKTTGPFPDWIGQPTLSSLSQDHLVNILDKVLSRYYIVDTLVISGGTEEHFRYLERDIPVYEELFDYVYAELKNRHPEVKIGNSFELNNLLSKDLGDITRQLSFGDFAAFTYRPTDTLNEITKTPAEAIEDLNKIREIVPDKKIGFFEIGWSTSEAVQGSSQQQAEFVGLLYDFYQENKQDVEFLTWYRLYDRPEGTCKIDESSIEGDVTLGNSTFVIERLADYVCNAGLLTVDGSSKSAWTEFSNSIESLR